MTQNFKMEYELYHHGILGQKWGVRRYQNKDGSLTPAGEKRAAKLASKYEKTTGKKIGSSDGSSVSKAKSNKIKDMDDSDLKAKVNRLTMEKQAYQLEDDIAKLRPEKVSAGKKFFESLGKDVIAPAAKAVGKDYLDKMLREKFGLTKDESKSLIDTLKEEAQIARYRKNIYDDTEYLKNKQKEDQDRQQQEKQEKREASRQEKQEKREARKLDREAAKEERQSRKERNKETSEQAKRDSQGKDKYTSYEDASWEPTSFTGKVYGEGTSRRKSGSSSNWDNVVDAEWYSSDSTSSSRTSQYSEIGKSYISGLLESHKKR